MSGSFEGSIVGGELSGYGWAAKPLALNSAGFCLRKLREPAAVAGQPTARAARPRSSR